ncbi:MAG: hypothetical protein LBM00_04305, partial [Deltaproteobacteria bacterium]|nr:hypothetical protein [Deltaproteobacteria bacterium]
REFTAKTSPLYQLKVRIEQRTDAGRTIPARRLKAAEQTKNHVFCFAIFTLQTERSEVLSVTWY